MNSPKKCFTINIYQTPLEVKAYQRLFTSRTYVAAEVFFPYQLADKRAREYLESLLALEGAEFVLHLPFGADNNIATNKNNELVMERMKKSIEFAKVLQVKTLTLHPGVHDESVTRVEAFNLAIKNTKKMAEWAKEFQMTIVVENLIGSAELCVTKEEMRTFLEEVGCSNVKFILDTGHAKVSGNGDLTAFVNHLQEYLAHVHLNDNHGKRDEHLMLGQGTIDFIPLFKALKDINYQGLLCAEVFHRNADDLLAQAAYIDQLIREVI